MSVLRALQLRDTRIIFEVDNKTVAGWATGTSRVEEAHLRPHVAALRGVLFELMRFASVDVRWIPRHCNRTADAIAKRAAITEESRAWAPY